MTKLLYIKANAKPEGESRTFEISDSFIDAYKKENPEDEIITLDLYKEKINFLSAEDINTIFQPKTDESRNHHILRYAYQFAEADKYVIAEPMWNLGIPAILKAYIDYICVSGITFKYTEEGPVGLCKGKRAINIVSRGGNYSNNPFLTANEMGDRYLRTIFNFLGITNYTTITADGLDLSTINTERIMLEAIKKAQQKARVF